MMTIMNGIANAYADAYTRSAGWITAHPVVTGISVIAMAALLVFVTVKTIRYMIELQ